MARNIMNDIGLSENTLNQKDTDVKKVVTFMELTFSDDIQVRKKIDLKEDYMPKPVELKPKCWCLAKVRAESQKEGALLSVRTGAIDDLFAQVDVLSRRVQNEINGLTITSETVIEYIDLLDALDKKLDTYSPVLASDTRKPHRAMMSFIDDLNGLTSQARIQAGKVLAEVSEQELEQEQEQSQKAA